MSWTEITGPEYCRKVDLRVIINALFYISTTGCQWRMLPKYFPPFTTVQYYFYKWCADGTWQDIRPVSQLG